jgi:hypothetical protein
MLAAKILFFGFVSLAGLLYCYGIFVAIRLTTKETPGDMPRFVDQMITTIGGVLATNLGAVLGIKFAEGSSLLSLQLQTPAPTIPGTLQIIAAVLYAIGLLAAIIAWLCKGFTNDPNIVVPAIPRLSQTLLGVAVGALALAIGVPLS